MLEQARNELYVEMDIFIDAYICQFNWDSGWAYRENGAQEYSTGYAQDLDEIRALWMAMAQRREALTVRDAHAMIALTVTCRSTWLGPLAPQHRSRGLLPTNAFFINNHLGCIYLSLYVCRSFSLPRKRWSTSWNLTARRTR
jgi:hypothetical protein